MLHIWLIERPEGPFFTGMFIEPETLDGMLEARRLKRGEPW